jgi:hypothetical protein
MVIRYVYAGYPPLSNLFESLIFLIAGIYVLFVLVQLTLKPKFFGLVAAPFGITPDTEYAYSAASHQEALNTLLIALQSGEGFIKITGEVGTGKTMLCRRFLATLGPDYFSAYLPNPALAPLPLLLAVADELGLKLDASEQQFQLVKQVNRRLLDPIRQDRGVLRGRGADRAAGKPRGAAPAVEPGNREAQAAASGAVRPTRTGPETGRSFGAPVIAAHRLPSSHAWLAPR